MDGAIPVGLPDFVAARLCNARPVVEWTSATSTIAVADRVWPTEIIQRLNLDRLKWPSLVSYRHQAGTYTIDGQSLPVFAAVGDHQCAVAGTLLRRDELSINVSTGSQVAMLTNETTLAGFQLRPYFDGANLKTVTHIPAGRALSALLRLLTEISGRESDIEAAWDYALKQAEAIAESDLSVNLAFFPGAIEGAGHLGNMHESNMTVGHVFRSAFEQMAEYYGQFASQLSPSNDWKRIVFSGGIAQRSPILRELIRARLGGSYRLTSSTEDTMIGLLVLARVISGRNENVLEAGNEIAARAEANGGGYV